ncbi:PREDICTED: WEB family protein At2g38370 isoform X1 [Tarenaya hassleriana]|uniref:WEB family protein At2g38370 isoform X1 n=1 Tax=Tarenaya hassleriana TaxID=28532 RepID=UPI00053C2E21|nr:PREDICTED: WEB family protein At2g38370 isoform X1 [Tarenaya hassleriana]
MAETLESGSSMQPVIANHPDPDPSEPRSEGRVEIDTSAPFESVREAATRFGGFGFWKPSHLHRIPETPQDDIEEADITQLEAQAGSLENELFVKERETLEVLKELESTKATVEELKSKLQQKEASEKENSGQPAGEILMELNQAKMNLCRTTEDLAGIRASVELLNKKLDDERTALEKACERLAQKSLKVHSLEKEVDGTETRLRFAKENCPENASEILKGVQRLSREAEEFKKMGENASEISKGVQRLSREAEEFKKMGENAKSAVVRAMAEIEDTRNKIKTAEIRLVAARKMKEAARAAEAVALAEIKAVTTGSKNNDVVMISAEEYAYLTQNSKDAEEKARKRVEDAVSRVDEANVSKTEILQKVDKAAKEITTSKRALEEALERVKAANSAKLEAEEALRKWRSDNGQRRRSSSVNNRAKFKNHCPPQHRRETHLMDVNGLNLTKDGLPSVPVLKPTMSIGQILSRKLLLAEESEMAVRRKVSLGQMLGKADNNGESSVSKRKNVGKRLTGKRKKFGFAKFSVLLNKESKKKKKKIALNLR